MKLKSLTRSDYVKKADSVFSEYIRKRDSNKHGLVKCPLCGVIIPWQKSQNMHFITRGHRKYRYDEDNCFAGCMRCNVLLHGNYQVYTLRMIDRYGREFVEKRMNDKSVFKLPTACLQEIIEVYQTKNKEFTFT